MVKLIAMFKNMNSGRGFTLIELLVVVSIISLLSSIVFGSLSGARVKAENSRIVQQYQQYEKALWLYYDKYGFFPLPNPAVPGHRCMSEGGCFFNDGAIFEDSALTTGLLEYMSSRPSTETVVDSNSRQWKGYVYQHNQQNPVRSLRIHYPLVGLDADCASGGVRNTNADIIRCTHHLR